MGFAVGGIGGVFTDFAAGLEERTIKRIIYFPVKKAMCMEMISVLNTGNRRTLNVGNGKG